MKTNRELLINALIDLSGDEYDTNDLIELAKEDETDLILRLISTAEYYREETNE